VSQAERSAATVAAILDAARALFATKGFGETSIDDIGARARTAKGAVYHHFHSKEEIFERVFGRALADVAEAVARSATGTDPLESMVAGTRVYLEQVTAPSVRRILLIDGPAILGWAKWREIDLRQFGEMTRAPLRQILGAQITERELEAVLHLLTGAITEASQIAASAHARRRRIDDLVGGLRILLSGLTK
jgi:AcrR family transcriptional regulator